MPENTVKVKVCFLSLLQKYVGGEREVEMDLSPELEQAIDFIIERFQIPWAGNFEKFIRVFINKELSQVFVESGKRLKDGDTIMFIPVSGGG